jgi:uncharacterized membrane protein YjjP (DUF1212 family)
MRAMRSFSKARLRRALHYTFIVAILFAALLTLGATNQALAWRTLTLFIPLTLFLFLAMADLLHCHLASRPNLRILCLAMDEI